MQVDKTYEYLVEHADVQEQRVKFGINCGNGNRGIYLREKHQLERASEFTVTVEPQFTHTTGRNDSFQCFPIYVTSEVGFLSNLAQNCHLVDILCYKHVYLLIPCS